MALPARTSWKSPSLRFRARDAHSPVLRALRVAEAQSRLLGHLLAPWTSDGSKVAKVTECLRCEYMVAVDDEDEVMEINGWAYTKPCPGGRIW